MKLVRATQCRLIIACQLFNATLSNFGSYGISSDLKVFLTCREAFMKAGVIKPLVLALSSSKGGVQVQSARATHKMCAGSDQRK